MKWQVKRNVERTDGALTAERPRRPAVLTDGLAGWLLGGIRDWLRGRMRGVRRAQPRLAVLERIALAPRQHLALVEAEGRRFLVATSPEGTPAFFALESNVSRHERRAAKRVSW